MDKKAFTKAFEKLRDYFELQDCDIYNFLKIAPATFSELIHLKNESANLNTLDQIFSIYNDSEANIALSKRVPLMSCIYFNLLLTSRLIKKLADEQKDPYQKDNILAKLEHFNIMMDFFEPNWMAREFFCKEDEIYYRICDAKKAIEQIQKKDEYKTIKEPLEKYHKILDNLEEEITDKRCSIDNLTKYDVAYKLVNISKILPKQYTDKFTIYKNICNDLDIDLSIDIDRDKRPLSFRISKAASKEDDGSIINFNLVLDNFFDLNFNDAIVDEILPKDEILSKIDSNNYTTSDWTDRQEKKKGNMPIYFIFKDVRKYIKTYIDERIWKKKDTPEFQNAIYGQYNRIKKFALKQEKKLSDSIPNIKKHEMWKKIYEESESWTCTFSSTKRLDRVKNINEALTRQNIARKVRKNISEDMKKNYKLLYVFNT